jgi:5-(carboxyamino)imidazole ribonucleotide mutase
LQGHDALLSTVTMPCGIPVTTVAIGKVGAKNAGYLAAQILGVADQSMADKVKAERAENANALLAKDEAMQAKLG